jgi:hypothetical protein
MLVLATTAEQFIADDEKADLHKGYLD